MRVAVYEHLTASGNIHSPLWVEGDAMLKAVIEDLKKAGHEAYIVDSLPPRRPVDLVIVIAPSTGRLIYSLVKACEDEGLEVVNSPSSAIFLASDKALLFKNLQLHEIKTPQTVISSFDEGIRSVRELLAKFGKVVVKPADGDGCIGLSVVTHPDEASIALRKIRQYSKLPYFLIQEYVEGVNVSVNVLSLGLDAIPLSINLQNVILRGPMEHSYFVGNVVPYKECEEIIASAALKTIRALGFVKGFFGVDIVLKDKDPYVIEVNPRMTTSYLALREVSSSNVLDMIVKAYYNELDPKPLQLEGMAIVEKLIASQDAILRLNDLKIPQGAKLLSTIVDKRSAIRKGDIYAVYVIKENVN